MRTPTDTFDYNDLVRLDCNHFVTKAGKDLPCPPCYGDRTNKHWHACLDGTYSVLDPCPACGQVQLPSDVR